MTNKQDARTAFHLENATGDAICAMQDALQQLDWAKGEIAAILARFDKANGRDKATLLCEAVATLTHNLASRLEIPVKDLERAESTFDNLAA